MAGIYKYPEDIQELIDQMALIAEQEDPMESMKDMNLKDDMEVIPNTEVKFVALLPIPNNLVDVSVHNWNITNGISEEFMSVAEGFLPSTLFNSAKKFMQREGVTPEPKYLQSYEGSMPRNFDLEWQFIPQNSGESRQIQSMIVEMKKWSSASPTNNVLYTQQPCFWTIAMPGPIGDMMQFSKMVVTNIGVNYAPGGYADFFKDGFPKQINLSISFAERQVKHREEWYQ